MKADKEKVALLLKTARGQLDGLLKMVEDDRYCMDISNQLDVYKRQPSMSLMGAGCIEEVPAEIKELGLTKALIVTDKVLNQIGLVGELTKLLEQNGIQYAIYDGVQPNPTVANVNNGLAMLKEENCDFVISFGGGSSHDCCKGIALLATNGGVIGDYEGVNRSKKPQLPMIAVNTTAGTASEMTIFCIITDEERHVKMALVDKNMTPIIAVNDANLMLNIPKALTAATGMDALTHAVEAYVSTNATPVTDACAPVSYTHLDVYKRQRQHRFRIIGSIAGIGRCNCSYWRRRIDWRCCICN